MLAVLIGSCYYFVCRKNKHDKGVIIPTNEGLKLTEVNSTSTIEEGRGKGIKPAMIFSTFTNNEYGEVNQDDAESDEDQLKSSPSGHFVVGDESSDSEDGALPLNNTTKGNNNGNVVDIV